VLGSRCFTSCSPLPSQRSANPLSWRRRART
jgi:hypothetical protein